MTKFVRLFSWWLVAIFLALTISDIVSPTNAQEPGISLEPEPENWEPEPTPRSKPRFNRFNRWMNVINEFFTEGNWSNGGPDNLLTYIGRTLSRLLDILFNRSADSPPIPDSIFNTISSLSSSVGINSNFNENTNNNVYRKHKGKGNRNKGIPSEFDIDTAIAPQPEPSGSGSGGNDAIPQPETEPESSYDGQEAPRVNSADMIRVTREMSQKQQFNMADIQKLMVIARQLKKMNGQNGGQNGENGKVANE